jgi:hypothetical protein
VPLLLPEGEINTSTVFIGPPVDKPRNGKEKRFTPSHPEKYRGDPSRIFYRSGWELTCMMKFDTNPNVLEWGSEEVRIPYRSALDEARERYELSNFGRTRRRVHTYFVDFYVKIRRKDGSEGRLLIEVKPKSQLSEPLRQDYKGRNAEGRFRRDHNAWLVNRAKWKAAAEYAADRGMQFEIYTEERIFGRKPH